MMKRVISGLLFISIIVSLFCTPVLGVQTDLYDDSSGYTDFIPSKGSTGDGYEGKTLSKGVGESEDKVDDIEIGGEGVNPVEFSIYVPSNITITVNKDGITTMDPEEPCIYNGATELPICVTDVRITVNNDWELVDFDTEFTDADKDSKKIALKINGSAVLTDGEVNIEPESWVVPADGKLALDLDFKAPQQTTTQTLSNVLQITFVADWYDTSLVPGEQYTVTLVPVDHATIKSTASTLYTDAYGRVPVLPEVAVDTGYTFDRWVDEQGDTVTTGQVIGENIAIHPVLNEEYCTVSFVASQYNGTISGQTAPVMVKTGTKWSEIVKPDTTNGLSATFMGWYNDGTELTDDFIIEQDIIATAEFMSWFTHDGAVLTGFSDAYLKAGQPTQIIIPSMIDGQQMTEIGARAFGSNKVTNYGEHLKSIVIQEGYATLRWRAFSTCWNVSSLSLPDSLSIIENEALEYFGNNSNGELGKLILPQGLKSIGEDAFYNSGWTSITTPDGCEVIGSRAFSRCDYLTSLTIGEGPSELRNVFHYNHELKTVTLPSTTRTFGDTGVTLMDCPKLETVQIKVPANSSIALELKRQLERNNFTGSPQAKIIWW